MQELAFRAASIVGCLGQLERQQLCPDLVDDLSYFPTQCVCEVDLKTPSRPSVPHIPMWYLHLEHFFEAERLCAQLQIRGRSVPDTSLVLDGANRAVLHFDGVGAAGQSQRLRPERDRPQDLPSPLLTMLSAIHPPMRAGAADGVGVVTPNAVAVDECTLPRAVHEVLDRGNLDDGLGVHSRAAPNARVGSAELRGWYGTVRQAAWTPSRAQASSRSGSQESSSASMPSLSSG